MYSTYLHTRECSCIIDLILYRGSPWRRRACCMSHMMGTVIDMICSYVQQGQCQ